MQIDRCGCTRACSHHSYCTVAVQLPYSSRTLSVCNSYSFRTSNFAEGNVVREIKSLCHWSRETVVITNGNCTATVRQLYGYCTATVASSCSLHRRCSERCVSNGEWRESSICSAANLGGQSGSIRRQRVSSHEQPTNPGAQCLHL